MQIFEHFHFTGREQSWTVPEGVTEATFECWGAAGGQASGRFHAGKNRQTVGGDSPRNTYFHNGPTSEAQLGYSFANNAGYVKGDKTVTPGEHYFVYVGGNGGPGHSTIRLNGTSYYVGVRGGAGGWNGGGAGGNGGYCYQNLYNSTSSRVHFKQSSMPRAAKVGELWYDTSAHLVKKCVTAYSGGNGTASKWSQVTVKTAHYVGPSGGGGGGATDIRYGGDDVSNRIMVAGGSGGSGGWLVRSGAGAATFTACPTTPKPPFGTDTTGTGATGVDKTWATQITTLSGGWGTGGTGGGSTGSPTADGGSAAPGAPGGYATGMHSVSAANGPVGGSWGGGGGIAAGGTLGRGGSGGSAGSLGQGGTGAHADGGYDWWAAGGGGGGGGYYGGGGGGQGFIGPDTAGGGGGGGSNYVSQVFTNPALLTFARPPLADGTSGTGANGLGGFARISYRQPPSVKWTSIPSAVAASSSFTAGFEFAPAVASGKGIAYYTVGTSTTSTDTAPTAQTTVMVTDPTATDFSWDFTAPAAGVTNAYFVKVTDLDGDSSGWLKQTVTGLSSSSVAPVTITSPAAGSQFINSATVAWTVGGQSPLVAYRLGCTGTDLVDGGKTHTVHTGWRRGGSRVNLAIDPGFTTSSVWSSTSNAYLVGGDASHSGVSTKNGKISWTLADDGSAENHTATMDNLLPGVTYRLHLGVASNLANDPRPVAIEVWDDSGRLTSTHVDLSATAAGTYVYTDLEFTPTAQGVYVRVVPSATGTSQDPDIDYDFEDGTTGGFTGTIDTTYVNSGANALKVTAATAPDVHASLVSGAGTYVAECQVYVPSASTTEGTLAVGGSGVTNNAGTVTTYGARDNWHLLRVPFVWDGVNPVTLGLNGDATGHWYDDIKVTLADLGNPDFGNTDSNQIAYLCDYLIEMVTEQDAVLGYRPYFDGSHLGSCSYYFGWTGTANESTSTRTAQGEPTVTNYVTNPNFETDTAGWVASGNGGAAIARDTALAHEGSASLKITATSSADSYATHTVSGLTAGQTVTVSGWVYIDSRTASNNSDRVLLVTNKAGQSIRASVVGFGALPTGTWQRVSATATVADGDDAVCVRLYTGVGTTHWDSIMVNDGPVLLDYFDGNTAQQALGTYTWSGAGTPPLCPSYLTGTDATSDTLTYSGDPLVNGGLFADTLSESNVVHGFAGPRASVSVAVNPSLPAVPTVALEVNNATGLMTLTINANDGSATYKTVSFDVFRNGVRIATGLTPDISTRQATFIDVPGHNEQATYVVRAWDAEGGYADQTDGSVTVVS